MSSRRLICDYENHDRKKAGDITFVKYVTDCMIPEHDDQYILLEMIVSDRKTLVESWKFRSQQQCLVKLSLCLSSRETCRAIGGHKTKNACIVEADESMRIRMGGTPHKNHEDHIAGKGINSLSHFNQVHKYIPMPQALKNSRWKGGSEKIMRKNRGNTGMAARTLVQHGKCLWKTLNWEHRHHSLTMFILVVLNENVR